MSAVKAYYTAQELAELSLPGLPTTKRRINEKASSESWEFRPREGRGGGREYPLYALPQSTRIFLAQTSNRKAAHESLIAQETTDYSADQLRDARSFILDDIQRFALDAALTLNRATNVYSDLYKTRAVSVPDWVWQAVPKFSPRTIRDWFKKRNEYGVGALSDIKRGPRGQSIFDKDKNLQAFILAQVTDKPHLKATVLLKGIKASDHNFKDIPGLRYLQQYIRQWKLDNARAMLAVSNPDAYRSKYEPAFGSRSEGLTRVNQLWEVDGTIADLQCLSPSGEKVRYSLTGMIDVFSRRTKVLVSRQPSAVAVGLLIRKCILDWGIPEVLKADNGKDYTAQYINRLKDDLGFKINYCTPFRPMEKPHIERFFGTLTRDQFEILPGYVGHDVVDRKAIESRRSFGDRFGALQNFDININGGELQLIIDAWIEQDYEVSNHRSIGTTPFLKAQQGGQPIRIEDGPVLGMLLAPAPGKDGIRIVQKSGISVNARTYIAPELGGMIGDHVHVKFDPDDESNIVVYSGDRSEFICMAKDPTLTDVDRQAIAKRAKYAQHQENKVFKGEMKSARDVHNPDNLAGSILTDKARKFNASKVIPFQPAPETPETPAFVRERKAASAMAPPAPMPITVISEAVKEGAARELALIETASPDEIRYLDRDDGSQRPVFIDDYKFIAWLQKQDSVHPQDADDLMDYLSEGSGKLSRNTQKSLELRGVSPFVTQLFKDMNL